MSAFSDQPSNMKEETIDNVLMNATDAAAAAIAHLQAAAAAASESTFENAILDDLHDMQRDVAAPTPDSLNDNDSGVETKSVDIKSDMDADSGDDLPPPEIAANARVLDVRCGNLTGKLYEERFTCPGIHKKCIEFDGRMISPRQFTIRAEKDKQKDWKGSIRVGRYNLRTLMEMKNFDFYEHESNCSLKCQSRNYIKNRKQAAMESSLSFLDTLVKNGAAVAAAANDLKAEQPSSSASFTTEFSNNYSDENGYASSRKGSALEEYVARLSTSSASSSTLGNFAPATNESTPTVNVPQIPDAATLANLQMMFKNAQLPAFTGSALPMEIKPPKMDNDQMSLLLAQIIEQQKGLSNNNNNNSFDVNSTNVTPVPARSVSNFASEEMLKNGETLNGPTLKKIMEQQPTMFWERMREMNLVDDLIAHTSLALEQLKTIYRSNDQRTDAFAAQKLSNLALSLELSDDYARMIQASYVQSALQQEIERKAAEEKRQQDAKRKFDALDQFLKVSQNINPSQFHLLQQLIAQQQQQVDLSNKIRLNI